MSDRRAAEKKMDAGGRAAAAVVGRILRARNGSAAAASTTRLLTCELATLALSAKAAGLKAMGWAPVMNGDKRTRCRQPRGRRTGATVASGGAGSGRQRCERVGRIGFGGGTRSDSCSTAQSQALTKHVEQMLWAIYRRRGLARRLTDGSRSRGNKRAEASENYLG